MTASNADREKLAEVIGRIAPQFFAAGHEKVFAAICCGRVLVTVEEPKACRTCEEKPEGVWVTLDNIHTIVG